MEGLYILKSINPLSAGLYQFTYIYGEENAKAFYNDTINDDGWAELYDTDINEVGMVVMGTKLLG